jgi:hypothetical protein
MEFCARPVKVIKCNIFRWENDYKKSSENEKARMKATLAYSKILFCKLYSSLLCNILQPSIISSLFGLNILITCYKTRHE